MKRLPAFALIMMIGFGASAIVRGQKGGKNVDVPVIATLSDQDAGVAPALQLQSDGGGAYVNSSALKSLMTTTGVWTLDATDTTRGMMIRFDEPIPGSAPNGSDPVAPATGIYDAWLYGSCNHFGNNPLLMSSGQMMPCPMTVSFNANGRAYILQMNGNGQPETNPVSFVCTAGTPCNRWSVYPSGVVVGADGIAHLSNVARLSIRTTSRGKTVDEPQGNFHMSFSIALAKQ